MTPLERALNQPVGLSALLRSDVDPVDSATGRKAAKDAIRRFFKAVASKDRAVLAASMTPTVIYEIPFTESGSSEPDGYRRYVGSEQVVEFWMNTVADGPKNLGADEVELSITADGSRVFIEQRGNMIVADGRPYRNRYVFRFSIVDGKVSHVREYFNPVIAAYAFRRKIANTFLIETL
jgi:ketosteroid isomerase-like protein